MSCLRNNCTACTCTVLKKNIVNNFCDMFLLLPKGISTKTSTLSYYLFRILQNKKLWYYNDVCQQFLIALLFLLHLFDYCDVERDFFFGLNLLRMSRFTPGCHN